MAVARITVHPRLPSMLGAEHGFSPSRDYRDARVDGRNTTAMHEMSTLPRYAYTMVWLVFVLRLAQRPLHG